VGQCCGKASYDSGNCTFFVNGLKPDIFREEMYSKTFENLADLIREAREELSTYRDILEISDLVKKS